MNPRYKAYIYCLCYSLSDPSLQKGITILIPVNDELNQFKNPNYSLYKTKNIWNLTVDVDNRFTFEFLYKNPDIQFRLWANLSIIGTQSNLPEHHIAKLLKKESYNVLTEFNYIRLNTKKTNVYEPIILNLKHDFKNGAEFYMYDSISDFF